MTTVRKGARTKDRQGGVMPIGKLDHYSRRTLDLGASRRLDTDPSQVTIELNRPAAEAPRAA
jgi:hypothetical protein